MSRPASVPSIVAAHELGFSEQSPEVFVANGPFPKLRDDHLAFLRARAAANASRKCRLLLHRSANDSLHEMLIVHGKGKYIRPHKNAASSKSFHIVEGALACVLFSDTGEVVDRFRMGEPASGDVFRVRLSDGAFHTLIPLSDWAVYVETILGPFRSTPYAPWAPAEDAGAEASEYFERLCRIVGIAL